MTCPYCTTATEHVNDDPSTTPSCPHWLLRHSDDAILLSGRDEWSSAADLLPAATHHVEDDPDIGHLLTAAYRIERTTGEIQPLVEAVANGWQLHIADHDSAEVADVYAEDDRDRIVERLEDVFAAAQWARTRGYRPDRGEQLPERPHPGKTGAGNQPVDAGRASDVTRNEDRGIR